MSLKKRLIAILVLFTALPLLVFAIYSIGTNDKALQKNATQLSMGNAREVQESVNLMIHKNFDVIKTFAQTDAFSTASPANLAFIKSFLAATAKEHPESQSVTYLDKTGQQIVRADDKETTSLADRDYFKQAMQTGQPVISDVSITQREKQLVVVLVAPILNASKQTIGTINNTLLLDKLSDYVTKLSSDGNTAFILDRSGKILAHPDKTLQQKDISELPFVQKGLKGEDGSEVMNRDGKDMLISYIYDEQTGWLICNEKPYDIVMAQSTQIKMNSIWIMVAALVLVVAVGFYFSSVITTPLVRLIYLTEQAAKGDLTVHVAVKDQSEVGKLAASFNAMILNLRQLIQQVESGAINVAASAEELTASAAQTSSAAEQVAAVTEEVAHATERQIHNLQGSAQAVGEVSSGIRQIAANAQSVSAAVTIASEKTEQGNTAVQTAVAQMNSISETVNHLAETIQVLRERSEEIEQIVDAITGIATQTNLLALNAGIEAARAGEHGRGFAVVASEVKKLAEQSANSAGHITGLIQHMRSETTKAVHSMNAGIREVASGFEAVNTAGDAFLQIRQSIHEVTSQIQEVSASSQQMSDHTQQVVQAFDVIKQASDHTASGVQSAAAATEEQLATMEEITSSANLLSKMADELQMLIKRFKI
ncbi:methyl-accepting chemotaxis protein [Paenibacillus thalictri]|uniref:methyl-accepting chemotaxis protein n=1 Tax=Paenibacillus thalictri TaxID=2527873 RepID=UPI0013EEF524|nr:methyl-accepting chemotaxis protein [Paenibacillus thalictri]